MKGMKFALAFAAATLAAPLSAQMYEKISVENSTGYTISEIYISPSDTDEWEEDVLDLDVLQNGQTVNIDFRRSENTCRWDMKVIYDDGEEVYWRKLDLCEDWYFELFYDRRTGETQLESSN